MSDAVPLPDVVAWRALLREAGDARALCVAYSGGADSSALLHHLVSIRGQLPALELRAIHVDHRLHADSALWARHCVETAGELQVTLELCPVDAAPASGESPEAAARAARYAALAERLAPGEVLVTAHHADDQAETLLLQLLRGAGPRGLAAMPVLTRFACGWLLRPLLGTSRAFLVEYCRRHGLRWVDDPANSDPRHDRSHLRAAIMPALEARWPGAVRTLARVARHQARAAMLLEELALADLGGAAAAEIGTLPVSVLEALSAPRRANALREWLRLRGAPTPSAAQLEEMIAGMLDARDDASPEVAWGGVSLRRHAGRLHLCAAGPPAGPERTPWPDLRKPLCLRHGTLVAQPVQGGGVRAESLAGGDVEVRLRRGGERLRPAADRHTRELKKLLHAMGIPPWQRAAWPLVHAGETLLAVPGVCVVDGHAAGPGEPGWQIRWTPAGRGESDADG